MTPYEVQLHLLKERNRLLAESVDLQREHLAFSKQQAAESAERIGDYSDQLLKDGIKDVLWVGLVLLSGCAMGAVIFVAWEWRP